ncbi:MAG: IPT/TIG domain-containing protein [Imperialibacter sp.]|uniref:IPT/TIG domain-containing protein n=1 Tax=Imperialibacter sp. TaxID=2038411 RepID=UPI0032EC8C18
MSNFFKRAALLNLVILLHYAATGLEPVPTTDKLALNSYRVDLLKISAFAAMRAFAGGDGSPEDPYQVSTPAQLDEVRNDLAANYILLNDIDLTFDTSDPSGLFWNDGEGWDPIADEINGFTGALDGDDFTISGLFINRPTSNYVGVFASTGDGGEIKNLHVLSVSIVGQDHVGALVGASGGLISYCTSSGSIQGAAQYGGGIAGTNYSTIISSSSEVDLTGTTTLGGLAGLNFGTVSKCFATGNIEASGEYSGGLIGWNAGTSSIVNSFATGNVAGSIKVGGLVGSNQSTIDYGYATGSVTGTQAVGGLLGHNNNGSTSDCYATGQVTGDSETGGFVGDWLSGTMGPCFWNSETSGQEAGGFFSEGLTSSQMRQQSSFEETIPWDFTNDWDINEGTSFPWLRANIQDPPPGEVKPPSTPEPVTFGEATSSSVIINWTVPNNNGAEISAYTLTQKEGAAGSYSDVYTGPNLTHNAAELTPGETYHYKVKATNVAGDSEFSDESSILIVDVPAKPAPVTFGSKTPSSVVVNWTAPANNGSVITGYVLEQKTGSSGDFSVIFSANSLSHAVTGLTTSEVVYFRVKATNAIGESVFSNEAELVLPPGIVSFSPTSGPIGTRVTITGLNFSATADNNAVTFNEATAGVSQSTTTTIVAFVLSSGSTGFIGVTVNGQTAESTSSFTVVPVPSISSFEPSTGPVGASVTVSGSNFGDDISKTHVFFGNVKGEVTTVSANELTVKVPAGATYDPISVTVNGLTAQSSIAFSTSFSGEGVLNLNSFDNVTFDANSSSHQAKIADLDNDGWPDVVLLNKDNSSISIYRNNSSANENGEVTFDPELALSGFSGPTDMTIGDLDGDGRLDMVVTNYISHTFSVVKNLSSPGTLGQSSFTSFTISSVAASLNKPSGVAVGDLNGDGKPEIIVGGEENAKLAVFRNRSTFNQLNAQSFEFVHGSTASLPYHIAVADIDQDGLADILVSNSSSGISVLRNLGTAGEVTSVLLADKIDLAIGNVEDIEIADVDGDGKPDIVTTEKVFRNSSTPGNVTFAAGVILNTGQTNRKRIDTGDLDGDGSPEIIIGSNYIAVVKNLTEPGVIIENSFEYFNLSLGNQSLTTGLFLGDLNRDGKSDMVISSAGKILVAINLLQDPPSITSVTPTAAEIGAEVVIQGANFSSSPDKNLVTFNGKQATVVTANSTSLTAVVPELASSGTISVTYAGQTATGTVDFVVLRPPVITSLSPTTGIVGTAVTINGDNFSGTRSENLVTFNGMEATVETSSAKSILVIVPAGATTGPVTVKVGVLTATSETNFVVIPPPIITSVNPSTGRYATEVTITGANFGSATSDNAVTFNGEPALVSSSSSSVIMALVPYPATSGPVKVKVHDQIATSANDFIIIPPPKITSVSPGVGRVGTSVTIGGTNFSAVATENVVTFNETPATVISSTENEIVTSVPEGASTGPVKVTIGGYHTATEFAFNFSVLPPRATQTIVFDAIDDIVFGNAAISLNAVASSGLSVVYAVSGPATLDGVELSFSAPGLVTVTASQPGNEDFLEASSVTQTFCLLPPAVVINPALQNVPPLLVAGTDFQGATYKWFLNGEFLKDDDASLEVDVDGGYQVQVVADGCEGELSNKLDVMLAPEVETGIKLTAFGTLVIYPNPASYSVSLSMDNPSQIETIVTLQSVTGAIYGRQTFEKSTKKWETSLDISRLPSGLFFIIIQQGDAQDIKRMIKQ